MMRRSIAITSLVLAGAFSLVACGGSDHSSSDMDMSGESSTNHHSENVENRPVVPGAPEIAVDAGALSFTPQRLVLQAGQNVTIVLKSIDIAHDLYVDRVGHIVHAAARKTEKGGLIIDQPGTYKFWCTVEDHKNDGMVGTITVTA